MRIRLTLLFLVAMLGIACGGSLPKALASDPSVALAAQGPDDDQDYKERDEIKKSVDLSPGARVEVTGINGTVTAETSSGNTAEIYIVRSARTREALTHRR